MQVYPDKFSTQLNKGLPGVVMIFGDEPQQKLECIDCLRLAAKQNGFEERQTLIADSEFNWQSLTEATQTLSLFSTKQYIELELPTGKPGSAGSKALVALANTDMNDMLLLVHGAKIGRDVQSAKWFKTLVNHGFFCQCYPLEGNRLQQWIGARLKQQALSADQQSIRLLADFCEGNMLAASQEIDKLSLLYPAQPLTQEMIETSLIDQSRFTVFQLIDLLLCGETRRAIKVLSRLESEGVEPNIIIWALIREWQTLWSLKQQTASGGMPNWQKLRIWSSKQTMYQTALNRLTLDHLVAMQSQLTEADLIFKQSSPVKPYVTLCHLCLLFTVESVVGIAI